MLSILNPPPRERQGTFRGTGVIQPPREARGEILVLRAELDGVKGERRQAIRAAEVLERERDAAVAGRSKALAEKRAEAARADLAEGRLRQMGQLWESFGKPSVPPKDGADDPAQALAPKTPQKGARRSAAAKTAQNRVAPGTGRRVTRSKAAHMSKRTVVVLAEQVPTAAEKQRAAIRALRTS